MLFKSINNSGIKKSSAFLQKIHLSLKEGQVYAHSVMGKFCIAATVKERNTSLPIVFQYAYFEICSVSMPDNKISYASYSKTVKKNILE